MTTPMCVQQRIRQLDRQGRTHTGIAQELGISRMTVVKYANREDWSPKPSARKDRRATKMDGYEEVVDSWLRADLSRRPKQRRIPPCASMSAWSRNMGSKARIRACNAGSSAGTRNIVPSGTVSPNWYGRPHRRRLISVRPTRRLPAWSAWCISWS